MTAKILWDIKYLRFEKTAKINYPEFIISNDANIRRQFYSSDAIKHSGEVLRSYHERDAFAYCIFEFDGVGKTADEIKVELAIIAGAKLEHLKTLLLFFWFVKDNSVCINDAIVCVDDMPGCVISSSIKAFRTNCLAKYESSVFSESEMNNIVETYLQYLSIHEKVLKGQPELKPDYFWEIGEDGRPLFGLANVSDVIDYSKFNCIERALVFLNFARRADYLLFKIAYYVPILECLFTTEKSEVMQKVRERAAFFLGTDVESRIKLFDFIGRVYDIRSSFLHGQTLPSKKIQLLNLSQLQ